MAQQSSKITDQKNFLRLLDRVAKTGVPVEIQRKGKRLVVSPVEKNPNLISLKHTPNS
jgi:virulence-associated protein VagC